MHSDDVRQLLQKGAARPSRAVEVGAILRQGRRLQHRHVLSLVAAGVAGLLGVAVAAANLEVFLGSPRQDPRPATPSGLPVGWSELTSPPEVRGGVALVWTGSELLAWGGCSPANANECVATSGGFAFDPETRKWRVMERAPRAAANADAVWTGTEAIFLDADGTESLEGQAYNPADGAWKRIATAPIAARSGAIALWTGSEVIVWGGDGSDDGASHTGAAYDPDRDQWRRIARGPVALNHLDGMWTGDEMLVFGSLLDNRNIADTRTSVGAAYDPEADEWREMQPSELSPQATSAVWMSNRMVAWDYEARSQEYEPEIDSWSDPVRMPFEFSECYPDSVVSGGRVFAFYCGYAALYDATSSTWQEIHGGPLEEEIGSAYKLWRFAQLVSTGDTVFLQAEGITGGKTGEVCYGCPGSPVSFWAYRPPE